MSRNIKLLWKYDLEMNILMPSTIELVCLFEFYYTKVSDVHSNADHLNLIIELYDNA